MLLLKTNDVAAEDRLAGLLEQANTFFERLAEAMSGRPVAGGCGAFRLPLEAGRSTAAIRPQKEWPDCDADLPARRRTEAVGAGAGLDADARAAGSHDSILSTNCNCVLRWRRVSRRWASTKATNGARQREFGRCSDFPACRSMWSRLRPFGRTAMCAGWQG